MFNLNCWDSAVNKSENPSDSLYCFFIMKPTRCTSFLNPSWHETLNVSGSSSAHHQEFIHCTLGTGIRHTDLKRAFEQDQDGTLALVYVTQTWRELSSRTRIERSSILVLLESSLKICVTYTSAECTMNKLLMMGRGTARNMKSFMPRWIWEIGASGWFYYKEICYDARSHESKIRCTVTWTCDIPHRKYGSFSPSVGKSAIPIYSTFCLPTAVLQLKFITLFSRKANSKCHMNSCQKINTLEIILPHAGWN